MEGIMIPQFAPSARHKVFAAIQASAEEGLTDEEICYRLGMNPSTQRPRRIELERAGLVADSGLTRSTVAGISAVVWISTPGSSYRADLFKDLPKSTNLEYVGVLQRWLQDREVRLNIRWVGSKGTFVISARMGRRVFLVKDRVLADGLAALASNVDAYILIEENAE